MEGLKFRRLRADEIDVRIGQVGTDWCSYLLYKDARVDMAILDETVGAMNWQKRYSRDNANCTVEIYDNEKKQWVSKEDTGTESNTEREKGKASDSFKRACFNWGIGRELYTAPFIYVKGNPEELKKKRLYVSAIDYDERGNIKYLVIRDNKNIDFYKFGASAKTDDSPIAPSQSLLTDTQKAKIASDYMKDNTVALDYYCKKFNVQTLYGFTNKDLLNIYNNLTINGKL